MTCGQWEIAVYPRDFKQRENYVFLGFISMKLEICERKLIVKSNILNEIQDFSYFTRVPHPLLFFDGKYFRGGNLDFFRFSLFCDVFSSFIFLGQNCVRFHSVSSQICHLFLRKNTSFWSIFVKKGGFIILVSFIHETTPSFIFWSKNQKKKSDIFASFT